MRNAFTGTVWRVSCLVVFSFLSAGCQAQEGKQAAPSKRVGGPFENAEYMYYGMPANLDSTDTSPGWSQAGPKLMVTGTVYMRDGKTPAPGIILYYYHTDVNGLYSSGPTADERALRHGYIRGWVKSDANGKYTIRTVRPTAYPKEKIPSHIHFAVKEPELNEYYVDDLVFEDDPLLTSEDQKRMENRGGSGILRPEKSGDLQVAEHDFILGLNIPDYPAATDASAAAGLQIGEQFPSFIPFHAWGVDRGSQACPVCKYGRYQGIVYVVGNHSDWPSIEAWLRFLEDESNARGERLKVYFVYGKDRDYEPDFTRGRLEALGDKLGIKSLALTYVPSLTDTATEVHLLKIAPDAESTLLLYRQRVLVDKFINFKPTGESFTLVRQSLERTKSKLQNANQPVRKN